MQNTEKTIAHGIGYRVYFSYGLYFVETGRNPIPGYESLQGAAEYLYYQGYIDSKSTVALASAPV